MATSLLSSLSLSNSRISQACVHLHPDQQKGMRYFSICLKKKGCMIPTRAISYGYVLKTFSSVASLIVDGECRGNLVSLGISNANESLSRSETLLYSPRNPSDGVNDFESQLQELFDEVKALVLMGKKDDAVDLLRANYEVVKEQINAGCRGIEEAATLDIIALGYMSVGDLKSIGSILNLLNKVVESLKDDGPLLESVLVHMGSMYSALGNFEKSIVIYRRVIGVLESKRGERSIFVVSPLLGIAKVLGSIGRVEKAVEAYHRAIIILESVRGAESEDLVVPLFGLGNLLMKDGKATDAETHFTRILSIYRKLHGENDGRVGIALCSLAHVKCSTGNVEDAVDLYRKGLHLIKESNYMAVDDNIMEKMRIDLAELLHAVGRGKEGRELLEECLLITENYKGKEHPSSVSHLLNLATSYSQSKNYVEAERLLRTSLEILKRTVSPEDQSVTFPMLRLAVTLFNLNRDEEAEQLALEVLRIREKAFGKESLPVGEALDCLVSIQSRLGRNDDELLELLNRVLKIQEEEFGYESEEVIQTLNKIIYYLDKVSRKHEKFSFQKRLSVLRMKFKQTVQY